MNKRILITGGVKSGKSRLGLEMALSYGEPRCFLATATALDQEMKKRIQRHQEERGQEFNTIEESIYLSKAIRECQPASVVLVDCCTLWLNNLYFKFESNLQSIQKEINQCLETVSKTPSDIIFITNEIGLGVIPDNALARNYMDELGRLNQRLAEICDQVVLVTAGIPCWIKGEQTYADAPDMA